MNIDKSFSPDELLKDNQCANNFYKDFGFLVIDNVFKSKECLEIKKRAEYLVKKDKSKQTVGFSLKKNNHHSDANFLSSAYNINYFYEDEMINDDGTFKDKKINCISKLGHCLHDLDQLFKKYSYDKRLKKLLTVINYKNPTLSQSSFIFKQPFIGGEYLWHQDSTYLLTNPLSCIAIWIAIEDSSINNGCLYVIPASHKEKLRKRVKYVNGKIFKKDLTKTNWNDRDKYPLCVKTGSIVIFHGSLAHKSSKNLSNKSRNAFVLHFYNSKTEYSVENWLQRPKSFPFIDYV